MTEIKGGYIHVDPQLGEYVHGDNKLGDAPINPGGQWDEFLPQNPVAQDCNGFEPYCCVSEGVPNCVETLEIKEYGTNSGWARRFLAKNSGTDTKMGNDPQTVCETLRMQGCTQATDYPFTAPDFPTFYKSLTQSLKTLALGSFAKFSYGHSWVNANPKDMMAALEYSPLSAAGYAWESDIKTGYEVNPPGNVANHYFMVYGYVENEYWKVRDSYSPFDKKLAWDYQFTGVKRHTLNRQAGNTPAQQTAWQKFINLLRNILGLDPVFGSARSPKWPKFKADFEKTNPKICAVCGSTSKVQLHHIRPYHLHPELELDVNNVIWLCTGNKTINCHLRFGHWDSFINKYNPNIKVEAPKWRARFDAKIMNENL